MIEREAQRLLIKVPMVMANARDLRARGDAGGALSVLELALQGTTSDQSVVQLARAGRLLSGDRPNS